MQKATEHFFQKPVMFLPTQKAEQWLAQQEMSNPGLPQDSKKHHSTAQRRVRVPTLLAAEETFDENRHLSHTVPFCYSRSDSQEYTEELGKALVLCDEAEGSQRFGIHSLKTKTKQNKNACNFVISLGCFKWFVKINVVHVQRV